MNIPEITLPERRRTLSADRETPAMTTRQAVIQRTRARLISVLLSFRNRQRRADLEIDDQLQLVLDLQEPERGLGRRRLLDAVVALRHRRSPPILEIDCASGKRVGGRVAERIE